MIQQQVATSSQFRWVVCALLFFATTINYIDRQILSLIKPILDEELKWTNEQFGVANSIFQGVYGFGLLFFGWFVDKYGPRIGYAVSIVAWSFAAAGHAFASSIGGFYIARALLGAGEGGNFPSAIKATAQWFKTSERALATSIFNSGTNVGAVIAPAIVPILAYSFGWQMPFILAGAAGIVWVFIWLPIYRNPTSTEVITPIEDESKAQNIPWHHLLRYRQTWSFIVAKFFTDPVWWFFLIWLPDFFNKTRGLDIRHSWVHLVTIYLIVTVLSISGGWVTGYLTKQGWSVTRARKTGMLVFAICVIPIFFTRFVDNWGVVLLIGLAGSAHQAWSANLYTTVLDMFPKSAVAGVIGIGGMAGAFGGMLFPIISGRLLDNFTAQGDVTGGYHILFAFCAFAYVATFLVHHLLAPSFEPVSSK